MQVLAHRMKGYGSTKPICLCISTGSAWYKFDYVQDCFDTDCDKHNSGLYVSELFLDQSQQTYPTPKGPRLIGSSSGGPIVLLNDSMNTCTKEAIMATEKINCWEVISPLIHFQRSKRRGVPLLMVQTSVSLSGICVNLSSCLSPDSFLGWWMCLKDLRRSRQEKQQGK